MITYGVLILLSSLVIFSYLFDMIAKKTKFPSVLLLLALGIVLKQIVTYFDIQTFNFLVILPGLGAIGLILIVFEGASDLKYNRDKNKIITQAFLSALIILLLTTLSITIILHEITDSSYYLSFINAIPFSVVSSSIAIPSVTSIDKQKREFIIYESSFSDILGIVLFNFAIGNRSYNLSAFTGLTFELLMIIVVAILSCLLLLYLMGKINHHVKFFLIISILILVYSIGEIFHLSALIIVLAFGLFLNNADEIRMPFFRKYFIYPNLSKDLVQLNQLSAESAFLIRTFFFVIFGFTIVVTDLTHVVLLEYALFILLAIYVIRFIYLKFFTKNYFLPEATISPRGLISILLFYNLPQELRIAKIETGILFLIILGTSLIMSLGILSSKTKAKESI